ncbi:MAG: N-acetylglutaminylglutamine synthetase [Alphaproteobacteria bacterium]
MTYRDGLTPEGSDPNAHPPAMNGAEGSGEAASLPDQAAALYMGWGRLLFGQTFVEVGDLVDSLRKEAEDERDIAIYVDDPHIALALAPQEIFLDPSHTYRLYFNSLDKREEGARAFPGIAIRPVNGRSDAQAVNRIYAACQMVMVPTEFLLRNRGSRRLIHLVAQDEETGDILGTVTGVDHVQAFNDPVNGCSLWCLAVDPQCRVPKVGEALVRYLIDLYRLRGRGFMDLSVMHDNTPAISLYEQIGFERIPAFTLKYKNPVNERLYIAPQPEARLNPYARIIINEARRRGIAVEIEDEGANLFRLSFGGRHISCRESLSDLTTAVALQRCDDKSLTHRLLARAGLRVPEQLEAGDAQAEGAFLERHERVVVKPAQGEQGAGISVDVRTEDALSRAIDLARVVCDRVLLEEFCEGEDLRIIVIGQSVVAAAIRRPATIYGDGERTIRDLIRLQSRRRRAATGGESSIPLDAETERCVMLAGYDFDRILPAGQSLAVRKTANLHTGGTIHDVTDDLHPELAEAAVKGARCLDIPVVGFDLLVPAVDGPNYVIIEANERPGLANHEPQPTAEKFIDLLFPQTASRW